MFFKVKRAQYHSKGRCFRKKLWSFDEGKQLQQIVSGFTTDRPEHMIFATQNVDFILQHIALSEVLMKLMFTAI